MRFRPRQPGAQAAPSEGATSAISTGGEAWKKLAGMWAAAWQMARRSHSTERSGPSKARPMGLWAEVNTGRLVGAKVPCADSTAHEITEGQSSGGWLSTKAAGGGGRTGLEGQVPNVQKEHHPAEQLTTEPAALPAPVLWRNSEAEMFCSVCGRVFSVLCWVVIQEREH